MMYVSAETKHVLSLPARKRSAQQIMKVKYWLSNIRTFAEYPKRMQQKLIEVGWYEGHPAKKVIIRQGHRPQAFYFLLCGSAVVTVMDTKTQISRTVHFLKRGDSFGELAILHDTVRQSTIITRELSEFLVISREDFVDIFMASGGVKNITDPDHSQFIKSISFLKNWPIDCLALNPKSCLFHFFRRGAVLVKDSNRSDWIYIIKSGSCRILKKLKDVESRLTEHQNRVVGFERVSSLINKPSEPLSKLRLTISALNAFRPTNNANNKGNNNGNNPNPDPIDTVAEAQESLSKETQGTKLPSENNEKVEKKIGDKQVSWEKKKSIELPPVTKAPSTIQAGKSLQGNSWLKLRSMVKNPEGGKRKVSKSTKNLELKKQEELPSNTLSFLDEEDTKRKKEEPVVEDNFKPVYVELANLTKGDTFGVNFMFFENQPSVSLVSNGAECIVISKKFFLSHCTEEMKRRLKLEEQPFPDDETLQKNLQDKINWQTFKSKTLENTVNNIRPSSRRESIPTVK